MRCQPEKRYKLSPAILSALASWLVEHGYALADAPVERGCLVLTVMDWGMTTSDQAKLFAVLLSTKIPESFPLNKTTFYLAAFLLCLMDEGLLNRKASDMAKGL